MKFCTKCIMPNTRPRVSFNEKGICSACEWKEIKDNEINWESRQTELNDLLNSIRGKN